MPTPASPDCTGSTLDIEALSNGTFLTLSGTETFVWTWYPTDAGPETVTLDITGESGELIANPQLFLTIVARYSYSPNPDTAGPRTYAIGPLSTP